ncbi:UDP-N-acetylmuramate dehydrogenase [Balneolaceae bacterium YR4-1]|uniref:UDP-N-acetylenolpyruvoylglucosamine reductase n=1 Tax=Halalkalibaculum roseum TaxID=2709311 RepID=A0A6M1SM88_9BACT|nr:UDP-N-acetylmuramate dehydrogenase [Halalkalibaculum roseum]NGP76129.1 UDP-N-acetylmuramate dehydrogenase [Halalkalibaculum roseum]
MTRTTAEFPIQYDVDLAPYNTLNIEAKAASFLSVTSQEQLISFIKEAGQEFDNLFVLGGGSNILFADDFEGLVLHVAIKGREVVEETDEYIKLQVGAGENWHETVRYCVEQGWGGIENLSLIPGTVGAAPIQNIGAYGVELVEVFQSLDAVELKTGKVKTFYKQDCRFGYRDSIFKNELKGIYIVTKVTLALSKNPQLNTSYGAISRELEKRNIQSPTIRDISQVVIDIRNSKLPNPDELGNAGSFFKNPVVSRQKYEHLKMKYPSVPGYELNEIEIKIPAGWLIEEAGLKGMKLGNAGTYKQQALVIVNHGGATGQEIMELAGKIKASVKNKFGIELVPEVNIVD